MCPHGGLDYRQIVTRSFRKGNLKRGRAGQVVADVASDVFFGGFVDFDLVDEFHEFGADFEGGCEGDLVLQGLGELDDLSFSKNRYRGDLNGFPLFDLKFDVAQVGFELGEAG